MAIATAQSNPAQGPLSPAEVELAGRFILGDMPVRLTPGTWWSYVPSEGLICYPSQLLGEWKPWQVMGAICHEAAEARFTGPNGSIAIARWLRRAEAYGVGAASAQLLVNTVNDMRVNRLHLTRYPGSEIFIRALYAEYAELHPKDDVRISPGAESRRIAPLHHCYLDALTLLWVETLWPGSAKGSRLPDAVSGAIHRTWAQVVEAAANDDVGEMLTALEKNVLGAYAELVRQWQPEGAPPDGDAQADGESETASAEPADAEVLPGTAPEGGSAGAAGATSAGEGGAPLKNPEAVPNLAARSVRRQAIRGAPVSVGKRGTPTEAERRAMQPMSAGVVHQLRSGPQERIDYTNFDYLQAVAKLEREIGESINGDGRQPGLWQIMDRRRHGSNEALRRPRKHRIGDQGELDLDRPERLLTDPANAFLRGVRVPREDRQRDFASSILLDISGSMVQKGYPTRKFDRLVETAILFVEIHERLRIPYEVIAFSSEVTALREFSECRWRRAPSSARDYQPKDHSKLFRNLYNLEHKDTDDAGALRLAIEHCGRQRGLKSIFAITDGISSDPAELRRVLMDLDRRNRNSAEAQRMKVLAFGVGVVKSEFNQAYYHEQHGKALSSCAGVVVDKLELLPGLVRETVDTRIRHA